MTHRKTGFTLVELMLAMSFMSLLLLSIALLVIQIGSVYNKGITLKSVNETGQLITSDIQRTVNTAEPLAVKFVTDSPISPTGGRLCVGTMVYAWNYGRAIASGTGTLNVFPGNNHDIRLIKFKAGSATPGGPIVRYCENAGGNYPSLPQPSGVSNLIEPGNNNLALHSFNVMRDAAEPNPAIFGRPVPGDPSQRIYRFTLVLGTNEVQIRTNAIPANGCQAPQSTADDEYCAVNEFDFTARAGNKDRSQTL